MENDLLKDLNTNFRAWHPVIWVDEQYLNEISKLHVRKSGQLHSVQ